MSVRSLLPLVVCVLGTGCVGDFNDPPVNPPPLTSGDRLALNANPRPGSTNLAPTDVIELRGVSSALSEAEIRKLLSASALTLESATGALPISVETTVVNNGLLDFKAVIHPDAELPADQWVTLRLGARLRSLITDTGRGFEAAADGLRFRVGSDPRLLNVRYCPGEGTQVIALEFSESITFTDLSAALRVTVPGESSTRLCQFAAGTQLMFATSVYFFDCGAMPSEFDVTLEKVVAVASGLPLRASGTDALFTSAHAQLTGDSGGCSSWELQP